MRTPGLRIRALAATTPSPGLAATRIRMILMNPRCNGWIRRHRGPTETRRRAPWRVDPPVSDDLWARVEGVRRAGIQDVVFGWRGRIRTFDLLIQSQIPESGLADAVLNVIRRSTALGFRVSQVPTRKRIRCPSEKTNESGAHSSTVMILVRTVENVVPSCDSDADLLQRQVRREDTDWAIGQAGPELCARLTEDLTGE